MPQWLRKSPQPDHSLRSASRPYWLVLGCEIGALAACLLLVLGLSAFSAGSAAGSHPLTRHQALVHWSEAYHHQKRIHRAHLLEAAADRDNALLLIAQRVANCEEGGNWHFAGSTFDGGIGFMLPVWQQFKRPSDPYWMHDATPLEQAL